MDSMYWQKQGSEPLFSDLEWNKPERRDRAGRLLIVGGNIHALEAPARAYDITKKTGIGTAKIVLPDKTKRLVGHTQIDTVFLPSTSSGEFSQGGNDELLNYALWADTVLIAGNVGRNSQTSLLLESLLTAFQGEVVITKDAIESLGNNPALLLQREKTTLALSFSQLQRYIKQTNAPQALQFSMSLVGLVEYLHTMTRQYPAAIATVHEQQLIVAVDGKVSTTKLPQEAETPEPWRLQFSSLASCYITWYPKKPFAALTHSAAILAHTFFKQ